MKGGKRVGAGRKSLPEKEKAQLLSIKLWPDLAEVLDEWQQMGYTSKSDALRAAIGLWASLWEAGIWKNQAECFDLSARPRRRLQEYLHQL